MHEHDFGQFSAMLDDIASVLPPSVPLSSTGKAMFFRTLANLPLEAVRRAFDAHVRDPQRGRFFPKPADVLAQIPDDRPGADEAWAISVKGNDEGATIVWTEEMAQAWGIARPVMRLGDEVGARVAFRDAYNRLIAAAKHAGHAVNWMPSLGHDVDGRYMALHEAELLGRIGGGDIAGLLPAPVVAAVPEDVRAYLGALKTALTTSGSAAEEPSEDVVAKRRTAELLAASNKRVREYASRNGIPL